MTTIVVLDIFLFFAKAYYDVKASGPQEILNLTYSKNKLHETLDYWSRDMLDFDFSEKGLGIVFPPHFAYDLVRKMLPILYSMNWSSYERQKFNYLENENRF